MDINALADCLEHRNGQSTTKMLSELLESIKNCLFREFAIEKWQTEIAEYSKL